MEDHHNPHNHTSSEKKHKKLSHKTRESILVVAVFLILLIAIDKVLGFSKFIENARLQSAGISPTPTQNLYLSPSSTPTPPI